MSHLALGELGGHGVGTHALVASDMPLSGHLVTFLFTCVTDIALIPPLMVMAKYRRHFEIYVGCLMVFSAFAYNFLDAMNRGDAEEKRWSLFIEEEDWHRISNVSTTTSLCLLAIHLAHIEDAHLNILLRYAAATLVLFAQIYDGFWMQETHVTLFVVVGFYGGLVASHILVAQLPVYWTRENLSYGAVLGTCAGGCFMLGLDDDSDQFRLAHGLSHLFGGVALTFLWNLIPRKRQKVGERDLRFKEYV